MKNPKPPKGQIYDLLEQFGEETIYKIWCDNSGMYGAAAHLSEMTGEYVSPYVIRAMSHKFDWKREVTDPSLPIVKGVMRGKVPDSYYKHLRFNIPGFPQRA